MLFYMVCPLLSVRKATSIGPNQLSLSSLVFTVFAVRSVRPVYTLPSFSAHHFFSSLLPLYCLYCQSHLASWHSPLIPSYHCISLVFYLYCSNCQSLQASWRSPLPLPTSSPKSSSALMLRDELSINIINTFPDNYSIINRASWIFLAHLHN